MYVIAEIGFNHEGRLDVAEQMIRAAAQAGAHAVKFQTYRADDIALPTSPHFEAIRCGEMNRDDHARLAAVAKDCAVDFLSTPYSPWAVDLLESLGVPAYKVASMDCTNRHLLSHIARTAKPIYLSTGMATLSEIAETLAFLKEIGSGPVSLLHCMSLYPAAAADLNLAAIPLLKDLFGLTVGYSDHYPGTAACLAAAMLGAEVIETHFTLDCAQPGGDHGHSADPAMLKRLIDDIQLFTAMRGDKNALLARPDRKYAKDYRRGLYAARDLSKGDTIQVADLFLTRPVSELSPNDIDWIQGRKLSKNLAANTAISRDCVQEPECPKSGGK